jgi:tripartite-type tricarboxylate transporter receptor subunit TctC
MFRTMARMAANDDSQQETLVPRPALKLGFPIADVIACVVAAASLLAPVAASAQRDSFPNKPIRLIVPFPPGGSADPIARVIGQKMSEDLGQQIIVDNRPGGNAVIGTELVAKSPPDGYTLLLASTSHVTNPQLVSTAYDAMKDFVPVATVSENPVILVVNPSVPAKTLQEFIALAKSRPTELNYSSAGSGNPNHLAGEMFNMMAGVKTTHIPYKGGAPAIADLLGGQVQFSYGSPIIVLPHIRQGKLRALAVSGSTRLSSLPDVPTFKESGLPDYQISIWNAVLAPAGTPKDVLAKLTAEMDRVMSLPEMKEKLDAGAMTRLNMTPAQFTTQMKSDMEKFGRIIKAANVKLD